MNKTYRLKTQDGRVQDLIIKKWRYGYITTDERLPEIAEKSKRLKEKYDEKNAGDPSPFARGASKGQLQVMFNRKIIEQLPQEIKEMVPKWPTEIVLENVYYNIVGNKIFINFFKEAKLK